MCAIPSLGRSKAHLWFFLAILGLSMGIAAASSRADDKPSEDEVAAIANELKTSRTEAARRLTEQFDVALKRLPSAKLPADLLVKMQDAVKAEKERFEKHGYLPFSEPMRAASVAYLQTVAKADSRANQLFSQQILKATRKKDDQLAETIKGEQLAALEPLIVGRWHHKTGQNPAAVITLLSNGRIGEANSRNHWIIVANGKFQLRWPNAAAPNGVWIDNCQLSPLGTEFKGTNQENAACLGSLVEP